MATAPVFCTSAEVRAGDADLEVEGGDAQPAASFSLRRLEQHAGQDGHGALLLDDALGAVERLVELVSPDLQLHLWIPF
jgi:hypothetical protein